MTIGDDERELVRLLKLREELSPVFPLGCHIFGNHKPCSDCLEGTILTKGPCLYCEPGRCGRHNAR